jgi:hypothetical protein
MLGPRMLARPRVRWQSTARKPSGIKALVKEYGYLALAIYFALSMIDLPIIYVMVHALGKEQIEVYENKAKQIFGYGVSDEELQQRQAIDKVHEEVERASDPVSVAEAQAAQGQASVWLYLRLQFSWTEFAIAYGIHKSLIFVRLPVTAAITPGIVKVLRRWGFKIGTDKLSTTAGLAKDTLRDATASSARFGVRADARKKWFWFF